MIQVSEAAAAVIESDSRKFQSRFLFSGAEVSGEVQSVKVYKGTCGESQFVPGVIYSSYLEVTIDYCSESLEGKELLYQIGVVIDDDTTEWYDIGYYTAYKPSTSVYTTSFTALGRISAKMGSVYTSKLTFPATITDVLEEISTNTGVEIDASAFDTTGKIETKPTGYMHREVLAYIAGIFLGYATEDNAGNVVFGKFSTTESIAATDGDRTTIVPVFADSDTEITGVKVIVSEGYGDESEDESSEIVNEVGFSSGIVNVSISNPLMTQNLFDTNVNNLIGLAYRPGTVTISMGDFRIEPFDCMEVTDSVGTVRYVPCMSVVHTVEAGITTEIIAPDIESEDDDTDVYRGALSKAVDRIQVDMLSVKTLLADKISVSELEAAVADLGYLTANEASITYATIDNLSVATANISALQSQVATISEAYIDAAYVTTLLANYADIELANVDVESVGTLFANVGLLENATIVDGYVTGTLNGVTINGDCITANTIVADSLVLKGSDGLYYAINATSDTLTASELTDEKYQQYIDGSVLVAKSITANQIAAGTITANEIDVENLFAQDITATGTITGVNLKSVYIETTSGTIGGFTITDNCLYSEKPFLISSDKGVYIGTDGISTADDTGYAVHSSYYSKYCYADSENQMIVSPSGLGLYAYSGDYSINIEFHQDDNFCGNIYASHNENTDEYLIGVEGSLNVTGNFGVYDGDMTVSGDVALSSALTVSGTVTINGLTTLNNYVTVNYSNIAFRHIHSTTGYEVQFGVGVGGYNRGVYDAVNSAWLIDANSSDNTAIYAPVGNIVLYSAERTLIRPYNTDLTTDNTGVILHVYATTSEPSVSSSSDSLLVAGMGTGGGYLRSYATYARTSSTAANLSIGSSGVISRYSSSSARYKNSANYFTNMENASEEGLGIYTQEISYSDFRKDMRSVLDIPVVQFHYNDGYMTGEPDYDYTQYVTSFIAEDVEKNCPEAAVYNEDGTIEAWNHMQLIPRMLFVIQEQEERLTEQEDRIAEQADEINQLKVQLQALCA